MGHGNVNYVLKLSRNWVFENTACSSLALYLTVDHS